MQLWFQVEREAQGETGPQSLVLVAPTSVKCGEPFKITISAVDHRDPRKGNLVPPDQYDFDGDTELKLTEGADITVKFESWTVSEDGDELTVMATASGASRYRYAAQRATHSASSASSSPLAGSAALCKQAAFPIGSESRDVTSSASAYPPPRKRPPSAAAHCSTRSARRPRPARRPAGAPSVFRVLPGGRCPEKSDRECRRRRPA